MSRWVKGVSAFIALLVIGQSATASNSLGRGRGSRGVERSEETGYQLFREALDEFAKEQMGPPHRNPLPSIVASLSEVLSDRMFTAEEDGERRQIIHREEEILRIFDILQRQKGKFPIVIGDTGVGKTEVINELTMRLADGKIPRSSLYRGNFDNVAVLKTSMRNFIPGGPDISAYIGTVKFISFMLKRKLMVVFEESHFANDYIVSVLREEADKADPLPILLEVDSKSYGASIKGHPSFTSIAEPVLVREPKPDQVRDITRNLIEHSLKERTKVTITDEVLAALVDVSPDYRKDVAEPRRSELLAEDFMVFLNRQSHGRATTPTRVDLYHFVAKQIGLPVIPQNEEEFASYMQGVKERMKAKIIGQKAIVDGVVDQFIAALTSRSRSHNIALLMGPTGVGKSLLGEVLAEEFYGDKTRLIELDMTQYKDAYQMSSLFGANNGIISSDKEKGVLCDFFDGRGKGGGIVIMNEIEEMSSDAMTRFMEMWDKGSFPGGDGKLRYVGRTLFILTSNKNSERILSSDVVRGMMRAELDRRIAQITPDQLKKAFTEKSSYTEDDSKKVKAAVLERVDRVYFASPLLQDEAVQIATLEINRFVKDYHKQSETRLVIDPSLSQVITSAFYNEALGARQVRTNVQQFLSRAINEFKNQHGFDAQQLTISATLHPSLKTVSYLKISDGRSELTIDGPRIPVRNKLLDAEFRQRLIDLEGKIKQEIFGQDEAIHAIVSGIKARYLEGEEGSTVAGFLLGVTGSGKTELAKAIAKHLFGRKEALGLFEMGRIHHMSDLDTILSPGKGIIGSDQPGELEQYLIQFPEGGVLLFDETSNAGGGDIAVKQAIAKQFYTMMDEGYYKSPSGKKYPLHNHLILFTGNDGEEVLKGLTSDSMLEETYNHVMKDPQFVKNLLTKAGFTDAFIGRLAFAHFMRPTLGDMKVLIATKLIGEWKRTVEKNQPLNIEFDDDIFKEVGTLMFSAKTGARSIREFVKNTLGPIVTDQVLGIDWAPLLETGDRLRVRLSVTSIRPSQPFYRGDEPDKTEALLKSELFRGQEKIGETSIVNFTKKAAFMAQAHIDEAEATAYHEMGHAVTSYTSVTGKKVVKVTIVPERIGDNLSAAGYTQYKNVPRKGSYDRDYLVKNLAGLLAGSEAEAKFLGHEADQRNVGRSNDVQRTGELARKMILESHLMPELDAAHAYVDSKGDIIGNLPAELKAKFDKYVAEAIEDARKESLEFLEENWGLVKLGSDFLMRFGGNMSGDEYELLETKWKEAKAAGRDGSSINLEEIRGYKKPKCEDRLH